MIDHIFTSLLGIEWARLGHGRDDCYWMEYIGTYQGLLVLDGIYQDMLGMLGFGKDIPGNYQALFYYFPTLGVILNQVYIGSVKIRI